ncbi:hypothetical protein [Zeimonas arvi]|uniref:Uncharacterized protein n=1 Tax=Zeimonas arvi TaxID=2498847 RepID=A0A5C8NW86_9BURK|nr:hypothetical protein [Zeimonas arvi]TXL65525.1 hypothetical protein FHP08_12165 [Zeimonas arvi]
MPRLAELDPAAVTGPEALQAWLAALPEDAAERLTSIGRLLVRFGHRESHVDDFVAMLEQVRLVLLPAVDECLAPLEGRQIPYGADAWRCLSDALTTMRALRTMYRRAASRMAREQAPAGAAAAASASAAPAGAASPRGDPAVDEPARRALPLIRALDLQARILATLSLHRVEPLAEDWDEFCALGRHARATGLLDAQVPDALPLVRPVTARALFVHPLLLRLAGLPERSRDDAAAAVRVASRVAAQIGFRVDAGAAKPNQWGPSIALTESWSVRLDTHRIPRILARRRELAPAGGAVRPADAAEALLADLERRWAGSADAAPAAALAPAQDRAAYGLLRFGLPRRSEPGGPGAQPPGGRAQAGYEFGRWERNTIVRLSMAAGGDAPEPGSFDPLAVAEPARFLRDPSGRILVERSLMLPPAQLGGLVALRFGGPAASGAGSRGPGAGAAAAEAPTRLGSVHSVEQLAAPGYERIRGHRVAVALWPGRALAVGLRLGAARFFDDAWLIRAEPGDAPARDTLVTAPGLAAAGGRAVLREQGHDRPIRFTAVLETGAGFERVGFAVDDVVGN